LNCFRVGDLESEESAEKEDPILQEAANPSGTGAAIRLGDMGKGIILEAKDQSIP